jgi:hypothetical protein
VHAYKYTIRIGLAKSGDAKSRPKSLPRYNPLGALATVRLKSHSLVSVAADREIRSGNHRFPVPLDESILLRTATVASVRPDATSTLHSAVIRQQLYSRRPCRVSVSRPCWACFARDLRLWICSWRLVWPEGTVSTLRLVLVPAPALLY